MSPLGLKITTIIMPYKSREIFKRRTRFRGGPGMRGRGGPPRGGPPFRGGPRGFRGGPMRGGGGDRGGRSFPPGPQGPGPHPVPTIESRGAPPQRKFYQLISLLTCF